MWNTFVTLTKDADVRMLLYLDDLLIYGDYHEVQKALQLIKASTLEINEKKSSSAPVKFIIYLGVEINLNNETTQITRRFLTVLKDEIRNVAGRRISLRYRQRIAGLLNFYRTVVELPLCLTTLAHLHPDKLHKFAAYLHREPLQFRKKICTPEIFTDATPHLVGLIMPDAKALKMYAGENDILINEYLSIWIAHILFPQSIIYNDNQAAAYLFRKGKLPPELASSYGLNYLLCKTFNRPIVFWVPTGNNLADPISRVES